MCRTQQSMAMTTTQHVIYRIQVEGYLDLSWSTWLEGMAIIHDADGTTVLVGPVIDQTALYGLLSRLRDLSLVLLSVSRSDDTSEDAGAVADEELQSDEPTRTQL